MQTGRHLGRCDFLKAVGKAAEEVLPVLAEAEPQVELQLGLDRPACGAEALLARKLRRVKQAMVGEAEGRIVHDSRSNPVRLTPTLVLIDPVFR